MKGDYRARDGKTYTGGLADAKRREDGMAVEKARAAMADREFVCAYGHWNGARRAELTKAQAAAVDDILWELQDGYGEPGYTPPQGWDWSGIRDSSEAAFARMAQALRAYFAGQRYRPASARPEARRVEAYGVKGARSVRWRRTFASREAMIAWAEKNDAQIDGTRDAE